MSGLAFGALEDVVAVPLAGFSDSGALQDLVQNRVWEVVSGGAPMDQTHRGGYALIPAASAVPYVATPSRRRFMTWV